MDDRTADGDSAGASPSLPAEVAAATFVVVAAFNESMAIGEVVRGLRERFLNVVVIDDGSTDETSSAARRSGACVLRHIVNRGQGAALQTGLEFALRRGAGYVVTFDADGQHCPEDIPKLLEPIVREECDIALGSRFLGEAIGLPASRRAVLRLAVVFTRLMNGIALTDAHNGLRAFSRRAAKRINITLDRMAHASELIDFIAQSGLRFREVPVKIRYTKYSLAKGQSWRGAVQVVFHYLLGRMLR